ncbi:MAG: Efflux transporter, RND family, MFP subunit [uncultured bacterium]|nr:MAG: Efflux transporter, RND family, MFP subunit [uncultured bacterium]
MLEISNPQISDSTNNEYLEKTSGNKKKYRIIIVVILLTIGIIFGIKHIIHASLYQSTDNAFIDGHIIQISPKVSGNIARIYVNDNQKVKKGDLLLEIDDRDYQVKVDQARAALAAAISNKKGARINVKLTDITSSANVKQASADVDFSRSSVQAAQEQVSVAQSKLEEAQAKVISAQADAKLAKQDLNRFQHLHNLGAVSKQQLDTVIANAQAYEAKLTAAEKAMASNKYTLNHAKAQLQATYDGVNQAMGRLQKADTVPENIAISQSQLEISDAEIRRLQAALKQTELNFTYTRIYAPESGYVTRKASENGAYIQPGQALMAIVPDTVWITANFKETQLTHMKPGQPVNIKVDAYAHKLFKGHVDSVQYGTGARFSLLPPENAVGSYVKVVQRVPVKIVFDEKPDSRYVLAPGMSVVPEVKVR